jgi:cobalt-zinc-cadmium efflux system outer membrane protein
MNSLVRRVATLSLSAFTFALALLAPARSDAAPFPTLAKVVERAREKGPLTVFAAADLKVSASTKPAAGLPPLTNPYLELIVDRGKYTQDVTIDARLFLPLELAGQRGKRIDEVDALVKWKSTAKEGAAAAAVGEAVAAYGESVIAATRLRDALTGEKTAREEAAYVAGRLAANDATAVDKALADGEVARWLQSKSEAELALALAKARLAIAIGEPSVDSPSETDGAALPALRWKDADALVAHLKTSSPALLAPTLEASFYSASRDKWEAEKYTPVNLILTGGRGDLGEVRFGAGLAWTFPVFRKNQAEIAKADAEKGRALTARDVIANALDARARGLFAAYTVARNALHVSDSEALPAAETVVSASTTAWKAGKLELTRVFLARRDLATARSRRLDMMAVGFRTYGELAGLLGELP